MSMITILVNGQPKDVSTQQTLDDALQSWGYGQQKVAVAINGEFMPKQQYQSYQLQSGDRLDVVKPVQGG